MKFDISKSWCATMSKREAGAEVGAGLLGIDPIFDASDANVSVLDDARVALGRFVQLKRRKDNLSLEELAEKADVELAELMNIEHDAGFEPEPRTLYQLAMVFGVSQHRLMGLSGLTVPKDVTFVEEAVRYAARSESIEKLNPEEQAALDGLISVLTENHG